MTIFTSWHRPAAEIAADLRVPLEAPNRDKQVREILALVNEILDGREAKLNEREAKLEEARAMLAAAHRFTIAALTDNGSPSIAAAFEAEFNRKLGL